MTPDEVAARYTARLAAAETQMEGIALPAAERDLIRAFLAREAESMTNIAVETMMKRVGIATVANRERGVSSRG